MVTSAKFIISDYDECDVKCLDKFWRKAKIDEVTDAEFTVICEDGSILPAFPFVLLILLLMEVTIVIVLHALFTLPVQRMLLMHRHHNCHWQFRHRQLLETVSNLKHWSLRHLQLQHLWKHALTYHYLSHYQCHQLQ